MRFLFQITYIIKTYQLFTPSDLYLWWFSNVRILCAFLKPEKQNAHIGFSDYGAVVLALLGHPPWGSIALALIPNTPWLGLSPLSSESAAHWSLASNHPLDHAERSMPSGMTPSTRQRVLPQRLYKRPRFLCRAKMRSSPPLLLRRETIYCLRHCIPKALDDLHSFWAVSYTHLRAHET